MKIDQVKRWQIDCASETRNIVIFGFSEVGQIFCEMLLNNNIHQLCNIRFCDNATGKYGSVYKNIKVYDVQSSLSIKDAQYVICSLFHADSIVEQLKQAGILYNQIFYPPIDIIDHVKKNMSVRRLSPHTRLHFEVDLAQHCNLKCKYCTHFSPLAEEGYPKIDSFRKDFARISELFAGDCERIWLLGGEPLLNKNITEFIEIARDSFPDTYIGIITNGLLLKSMNLDFWDACQNNNIVIVVTKYPIGMNYEEIEDLCREHDISLIFSGNEVEDRQMSHYPLCLEGGKDINKNFSQCNFANKCITLRNGILYTCTVIPNICHFNRHFSTNLQVTENDGIDIYKAQSGKEILDFLAKPTLFCQYCDVDNRTYNNKWDKSRKDIKEWTI